MLTSASFAKRCCCFFKKYLSRTGQWSVRDKYYPEIPMISFYERPVFFTLRCSSLCLSVASSLVRCSCRHLWKAPSHCASAQFKCRSSHAGSAFVMMLWLGGGPLRLRLFPVPCACLCVCVCVCAWRSAAAGAVLRSLLSFLVSAGTLVWRLTCGWMPTYPLTLPIRLSSVCGAARNLKNTNFPIKG